MLEKCRRDGDRERSMMLFGSWDDETRLDGEPSITSHQFKKIKQVKE